MFYSDQIIEEVMSANDILDVISSVVPLKKKGGTYFGLCPFHNEKTPSFSVSPGKQMYYCFGCGEGGNVVTFVMKYENYTFQEALQFLAQRCGIALPERQQSQAEREQADLKSMIYEVQKVAANYFYNQLKSARGEHARKYLENRGLSQETIIRFGLGYSNKFSDDLYKYLKNKGYSDELLSKSGLVSIKENGSFDKFWNRVMFPIMNGNNKVIAFGGRVMGEGEPKYLNSPETLIFDKSRNLYGLNFARTSKRSYLIVCEGYMDVIALHQAGFTNAIATLGTAFTQGHASLIKRYTKEVYLAYDTDGAGKKAAIRAIPILKEAGIIVKILDFSPAKDPDEFVKLHGAEALEKRIEEAEYSFVFEIRMLSQEYDRKNPEEETQFQKEIALRLLEFEDALERGNYIRAVADNFFISGKNLETLVNKTAMTREGYVRREKADPPKSNRKEKPEAGQEAERILFSWLTEDASIIPIVQKHINANDFTDPFCAIMAKALFQQMEAGKIVPAKIVNYFQTEEEQKRAAMFLNARIHFEKKEEKERALRDVLVKIKEKSLDRDYQTAQTPNELVKNRSEKANLKKLVISLD